MIEKDRKGFLNKTFQKATFGKHDTIQMKILCSPNDTTKMERIKGSFHKLREYIHSTLNW